MGGGGSLQSAGADAPDPRPTEEGNTSRGIWTPLPQLEGPPPSPAGPEAFCSEAACLTLPRCVPRGGQSVPGSNPIFSWANRGT